MRKFILAALLLGSTLMVNAQSGTNSPYSQYGLGVLSEQTSGFNRGMNGVGLGFHEHNQINYLNPASYAAIDSMTFILDAGISGQVTNFNENGVKKNANNSNLEYVVAGFRLFRHLGMSFGIIPFTNVGYNYSTSGWVNKNDKDVIYTNSYEGEGGLHQVYVGAGWSPLKGLSVGANIGYIWGSINRTVQNNYSNSYYKSLYRTYGTRVNNYKIDLGVQYTQKLSKKDEVTLGVTYSPGHNLHADADMSIISSNAQTSTSDTLAFSIKNAYELPTMYGAGLMWNHNNQWKIGVDYSLQKWGSLGVAHLAQRFASEFGMGEWGYILGLLHDKGKEKPEFQDYIRCANGIPGHTNWTHDGKAHAYVGALLARKAYPGFADAMVNQLAGHHAGLYDYTELQYILQQPLPRHCHLLRVQCL